MTHYEVITEYPLPDSQRVVTKVRLRLETGLRHQIRVQAAAEGLPLIGDRTYNAHYQSAVRPRELPEFPRQALHAAMLALEHPDRPGTQMSWEAVFPKDLRQLESALARGRHH